MQQQGKLESAGCDWLTMTWKRTSPIEGLAADVAFQRLTELESEGEEIKKRQVQQFNGWGTKHLKWGWDETHSQLVASSHEGHVLAQRIIERGCSGNTTRIDLEVTAEVEDRAEDYFQGLRERIGQSELGTAKRLRKNGSYYFAPHRDLGISLGAGTSERRFRAYSAIEGGHPECTDNAVRYEWQHRGKRARQLWDMMKIASSVEVFAASIVTSGCLDLGIQEDWFGNEVWVKLPPLKVDRDIETTFSWYENQVFPSFIKTIEAGYGERLYAELTRHLTQKRSKPQQVRALEMPGYAKSFKESRKCSHSVAE